MIYFKPLHEVDLKILCEWFQEPTINQWLLRKVSCNDTDIAKCIRTRGTFSIKAHNISLLLTIEPFDENLWILISGLKERYRLVASTRIVLLVVNSIGAEAENDSEGIIKKMKIL